MCEEGVYGIACRGCVFAKPLPIFLNIGRRFDNKAELSNNREVNVHICY